MTKLTELYKKRDEIKNQINTLKNEGKVDEAHEMLAKLKDLNKEIEVEETLEHQEKIENSTKKDVLKMSNVNPMDVMIKLLMKKSITDEERTAYLNAVGTPGQAEHTPAKGGYLVPVEQATKILEFKRSLNPLKNLCDVISVQGMEGVMPVEVEGTGELIAFDELNVIRESDVDFTQLKWSVSDYGDIIPVSNTLLADEKAGLIPFIKSRFAKKAVMTENKKIIALVKTANIKQTGTDVSAITTALNTKLDVALRSGATILCNQTSFDWLDNQKATDGRPLLTPDMTNPSIMRFKGLPIKVVNDDLLGSSGSKKEFYVGNFSEFLKFFDRQGLELAISNEAGFTKNATLLRVIERFDVKVADSKALIKVEITPAG